MAKKNFGNNVAPLNWLFIPTAMLTPSQSHDSVVALR